MSRARQILKILKFHEGFNTEVLGDLTTSKINFNFKSMLDKYNYNDVEVDSIIDIDMGICVKFTDIKGESTFVLFRYNNSPECLVIEDDEEVGTLIDLSPVRPKFIDYGGAQFIDLIDLSWMNKSVFQAIFHAGKVNEDFSSFYRIDHTENDVEDETYVFRNRHRMKLPIVKRSKSLSPEVAEIVKKLKMQRPRWFIKTVRVT